MIRKRGVWAGVVLTGVAVWLAIPQGIESPTLRVQLQPDERIKLSWPQAATGFVLEETEAVGPGANWQQVSATPVVEGDDLTVLLETSASRRYFRLHSLATAPLTRVLDTSPASGANGVAVSSPTIFYFSSPLV